jgi:hypothetical protein
MWEWLKDPDNERVLGLLGGAIAFLWTAGWGVWVYVHPSGSSKSDTHPEWPDRESTSQTPSSRRSFAIPKFPLKIWAAGLAVVVGVWFGLQNAALPTVTATYKVCRGQYESNCDPHNLFVGCSEGVNTWANRNCAKFNLAMTGARAGDLCGYSTANLTCTLKPH